MSEGVEVLEVEDDHHDYGRAGPSLSGRSSLQHRQGQHQQRSLPSLHLQHQPQQQPPRAAADDAVGEVIDLDAEEPKPSSIRTSRSVCAAAVD